MFVLLVPLPWDTTHIFDDTWIYYSTGVYVSQSNFWVIPYSTLVLRSVKYYIQKRSAKINPEYIRNKYLAISLTMRIFLYLALSFTKNKFGVVPLFGSIPKYKSRLGYPCSLLKCIIPWKPLICSGSMSIQYRHRCQLYNRSKTWCYHVPAYYPL